MVVAGASLDAAQVEYRIGNVNERVVVIERVVLVFLRIADPAVSVQLSVIA
jgi:hypothetical protein